tara:strand:- start:18777 stop:19364 length:588 start_codon:yes stop_codon:yes gene_type:complete
MQNSQQTLTNISQFEIYEATIGDHVFDHVDNQLKVSYPHVLENMARLIVALYYEEQITDAVTIMAANNEFYLHPGTNRYLVSKVLGTECRALIINRWNTSYYEVKSAFPDAVPYEKDFPSFVSYVNKFKSHRLKPHRTSSKNIFELTVTNMDPFRNKGLIVNGRVFGNPDNAVSVTCTTAISFAEHILRRFTDYE